MSDMRIFITGIILLLAVGLPAQYDFSEKKERHKIWRKTFRKKRQSYNPYLDRKRKDKPSAQMARENKKDVKRQQRNAKKVMRKNRREIGKANRRRMKGN